MLDLTMFSFGVATRLATLTGNSRGGLLAIAPGSVDDSESNSDGDWIGHERKIKKRIISYCLQEEMAQ